jgi:acyl-coenzyme A synthetase/AMP-(fatty) acid ligase
MRVLRTGQAGWTRTVALDVTLGWRAVLVWLAAMQLGLAVIPFDRRASPTQSRLPDGEQGTLYIKGPNVMKGYYDDAEATAFKFQNGWLCTADRASKREGRLRIYGRQDDLLIRAGERLSARIESALLELEGVNEALAYSEYVNGRLHIRAAVVAVPGIDSRHIRAELARRGTETRLIPDSVECRASLPKSHSGKLLRPKWKLQNEEK